MSLPLPPPETYGNKIPSEPKAQPSETIESFQTFPIIFLTFFSLNTLKSTFKKLLISGYQAGVKFTSPPTSPLGWQLPRPVNVYQCEPDPEPDASQRGSKV